MVAIRLIGSILPATVLNTFRRGSLLVLISTLPSNAETNLTKKNFKKNNFGECPEDETEFIQLS
jgi:hypothetical protein